MEFAIRDFFRNAQEVLQTWLTLTVFVSVAAIVLFFAVGWPQLRRAIIRRRQAAARPPAPSVAQDLRRYAEEVAVAAGHARMTADLRRAEWFSAVRNRDAVWKAYDVAESAAARIGRASAFPVALTPFAAGDPAAQQAYIRRLATEAHSRGALSTAQLNDILAQRNGWGPGRHAFEQEQSLRRIARDGLLRAYQTATELERNAWQALEVANASRASLDREALSAALQARGTKRPVVEIPRPRPAPYIGTARVPAATPAARHLVNA